MSSLKENKTCQILEQYLSYLTVIKGRSPLTAVEYRIDVLMLFAFVKEKRGFSKDEIDNRNFSDVTIDFIRSITINDMYDFITYCGAVYFCEVGKVSTATRSRKIVSIRQFWKYLKNKAHLLNDNDAGRVSGDGRR